MADWYKPGDHNVICDRTGFKIKSSQARMQWDGSLVRKESWEPRHPQDFLRAIPDFQAVEDPRPDPAASYLTVNQAYNALLDPDVSSVTASAAADGGNTGDGTVANLTADPSAESSYTLTVTRVTRAAATLDPGDSGAFRLVDASGLDVATGQIDVAFEGVGLAFTLTENGSVAFAVGDKFTITVV